MLKYKVIAVDFDNTLTLEDKYPEVGILNLIAVHILKQYREMGGKIILFTCRSDEFLAEAVEECKIYGLEFDAVNDNIKERKIEWNLSYPGVSFSPKPSYDLLIDDKNIEAINGIDWVHVKKTIMEEE